MKKLLALTSLLAGIFGASSRDLQPSGQIRRNRSKGRPRRSSRLFLKSYPENHPKLRFARSYKRVFGGVCGCRTWPELAQGLRAAKLEGQGK